MINIPKQLCAVILFISANFSQAQIKIELIYPKEGNQVIAAESTFVFGNVSPVEVDLSVNNISTEVYPNGAFLAFVPVEPGNFSFTLQAIASNDTARMVRNVNIPHYLKTSSTDHLVIDTSYVFPKEDWELQPGEVFRVAFKGSPNCKATFSIEGLIEDIPMAEILARRSFYWGEAIFGQGTNSQMTEVKGIYTGAYFIKNQDQANARNVRFKLKDQNGNVTQIVAPGKFNIENSATPKIGEFTKDTEIASTGFGSGGKLSLSQGVKVQLTAQRGNYARIKFSKDDEIWIRNENIKILATDTPLSRGVLSNIQTETFETKTRVKICVDQKLPYKFEQGVNPTTLLITLYNINENIDWIKLDYNDPLIKQMSWERKTANVYQVKIELNQDQHWGYHPYYEDDGLIIDIKKKPNIHGWPNSSLKDIVICLDPGHGPEFGAIGPKGFTEKDLNYRYCVALKQKLEERGAFVVLTRGENYGASMKARTQLAIFMEADILLSLHFNALPDGVNPFKYHGISTYYYHPQSHRLASMIQKKLVKQTKVKDFGLFCENLAICRPSQMIAVLVEPGFIMHPWEEILIASETYQERVVDAVVNSIEEFLKESK